MVGTCFTFRGTGGIRGYAPSHRRSGVVYVQPAVSLTSTTPSHGTRVACTHRVQRSSAAWGWVAKGTHGFRTRHRRSTATGRRRCHSCRMPCNAAMRVV